MTLSTGQIINNRYRIVKLLGQGGFGAVYRAWDLNISAPCALKENFDTSPEAMRQFAREATILANLHHPNLPRVTDHFSIPGQGQYLVMDYVEGQDLSEIQLQRNDPLPEGEVLDIARQVCQALEYLHSRTPPIVHRDIKPANIRVKPDGTAMLVDFGIAKVYDPTLRTTLGARAVTPGYSPFEQYGQKPTDARTDIYALGATLYSMLTGSEPVESIERVSGSELPPPRRLNPHLSESTEQAILKALQIFPNDRFQSMADFRTALLSPQPAAFPAPAARAKELPATQIVPEPISSPPAKPPSQPRVFQTMQPPSQPPAPASAVERLAPVYPPVSKTGRPIPIPLIVGVGIFLLSLVAIVIYLIVASQLPIWPFSASVYVEEVPATRTPTATTQAVAQDEPATATPKPESTAVPETPAPTLPPLPTPTATYPPGPRTLVICLGQEPDSLYPYGTSMLAASQVLEAIYDGPIDSRTYSYQPTILEKLPSLADGDAIINTVNVSAGDMVVDNDGNPGTLTAGMLIRPAGCHAEECAVSYNGTSTIQMEQMVVTFRWLPGLTYSDGTPLTAADSLYSFNLSANPDTPTGKYVHERTASYQAPDDLTNVWTGMPGYRDATYFINIWAPYPQHLWGQYAAADLVTEVDNQGLWLGWGPYSMQEWVRGDHITLRRNPRYFRASEGLPRFDTVVYRIMGENSNANIAAILAGECDIVDQTSGLEDQSEYLLELQAAGQINAEFTTGTTYEHADFNIHPLESYRNSGAFAGWDTDGDGIGPFGDVRLRQAIAMCMDRQAVVDTVFYGQSITIDSYIPPDHPLYNPNNTSWPYDPTAAGQLLDEIGWLDTDGNPNTPRLSSGVEGVPNGTRLQFAYETTAATQRMQATQIMAESARACGIQMDLGYYPASEWFADGPDGRLFGRHYDLGQFAWLTGVEPPCGLYTTLSIPGDPDARDRNGNPIYPDGWGGQNNTGYSNPEYDAWCDAAVQSLPGEAAYTTNHLEAQRIFSEELPSIPLYLRLKLAASRPDMCGFFVDPTHNSEMWNIEAFGYGDECR